MDEIKAICLCIPKYGIQGDSVIYFYMEPEVTFLRFHVSDNYWILLAYNRLQNGKCQRKILNFIVFNLPDRRASVIKIPSLAIN